MARKVVRKIVGNGDITKVVVNAAKVTELLGPEKFRDTTTDRHNEIGATARPSRGPKSGAMNS